MIHLIHGDNFATLRALGSELEGRSHLVYLDPPFATGRTQSSHAGSYEDPGDLVEWQRDVTALVRLLSYALHESGSLVLHCDWRTVHVARHLLDDQFGRDHFASEIIWSYRRWPSKTTNFQHRHDTLLRYVKTPGKHRWNQLYEAPSASTLATWGTKKQRAQVVGGKRVCSKTADEESPGVPMGDVWELQIIAPVARERTGYPTQKPEALLERIVMATTNPGDLVIDPYCGSGTTLAVCERLGRSAIGIDRNEQAIEVCRRRIA